MVRPRRIRVWAMAWLALAGAGCLGAAPASADAIPVGDGQQTASISGVALEVFTYRPAGCTPRAVLLVFHGVGRNPDGYRDHAKPLADAACGVVVAPYFDKARFPSRLYQYGGVAQDGTAVPAGHRTVDLIAPLAAWAESTVGGTGLQLVLIGHSAGAQFLGRVAAFAPPAGARYLVVNPSTWVMPSLETKLPYGFGGMAAPDDADRALRAYLALPLAVLLGGIDTGTHELAMEPPAMAQGPNRLRRGHNAFDMAREVARQHGWAFGWTLAEVPGVGHDATRMFASPQAIAALPGR
jgi:dienelactone hydrolase